MKKSIKRFGAILMALSILFSLAISASAATVPEATIDFTRTGSIDIYKYDLTRTNADNAAATMIDSYVSTGVRDTALEAVLDNGSVNNLGNGQQSYGYAVKGVEFGAGFAAAGLRGSENNDPFSVENGRIITTSNHCGGILGGITDGMPLTFRAAVKPTPSIARPQQSVNLKTGKIIPLTVTGRHDPCIVPRAVPCIEAAAAIAVYDALLARRKEQAWN